MARTTCSLRPVLAVLVLVLSASCVPAEERMQFLNRPLDQWLGDLHDEHPAVRRSAAFVLGKMTNPSAVPDLVTALQDRDPSVRAASAFALGEIGPVPRDSTTLGALIQALADPEPTVRRGAACALGKYGTKALAARIPLQQALRDDSPVVRQNAAWALGQMGDAARTTVPALQRVLEKDDDALVRRDTALALGKIGREAHAALPALLQRFQDAKEDPVVRRTCLDALVGVVGKDDKDAVPVLRRGLDDPDPDVVRNAAFALANIGGQQEAALPVLRKTLQDRDALNRRLAAAALANIGPYAEPALPELKKALADPDPEVRRSAALAVGLVGRKAHDALPDLIGLLDSSQPAEVRKFAAEALANIDPDDPAVVRAMLHILDEGGDWHVRHRAVWVLERLRNFEQDGVVAAIAGTLVEEGQDSRLLRYEAAKVLANRLGPRVPDRTLDVLLEALRDDSVKIYRGTGAKVSSSGSEVRTGETQVKESGTGDWRSVVAGAVLQIGARAARRKDILEALQAVAKTSSDPQARQVAKDAYDKLSDDR